MVQLADHLTLDAPRRTSDGYLAVRAKAARLGVYQYSGRDVDPDNQHGLRDRPLVNVMRDEATVMDRASIHSFIGKPITDDHPTTSVTSANWRDLARGIVMGAARDGEFITFDLMLTDRDVIAKVDAGKRELSNGYEAGIEFGDFTAADGTKCEARQTSIKGNHVALVDKGRAGPDCRIGDASHRFAVCDANPAALRGFTETPTMKIKIGDAEVDATNGEAVRIAVDALTAKHTADAAALATAQTQVATLTTQTATDAAKIATLESQLADAKLTPERLRDAAKAYAAVTDKAKALGVTVTDAMDETSIKKATVTAKLGDVAKDWTDEQIAASFDTLTADAKGNVVSLTPVATADADAAATSAYQQMIADMRGTPAKAA